MPTTTKASYRVPVFDGGLNSKRVDLDVPPNQSPDLLNVTFDDGGAVGTCKGFSTLNTAAIGSGPIDGLHGLYQPTTGGETLLAVCSGTAYATNTQTFTTIPSAQSVFTAGQDVRIVTVEEEAYFSNGWVTPYRYDGSNFVQVGVPEPTSGSASAVSGALGDLVGNYRWAISGLNANGVEGNYAPITTALVAITSGQADITGIPVFAASAGVSTKYLYRTTAGSTAEYYRVTALSAAQTTYTDVVGDASIPATTGYTDHNQPEACKFMVYHRGRLFMAGDPNYPDRLYYSDANQPEIFGTGNAIDIGKGDGYPISGIRIMGNSLAIHKNDDNGVGSIYLLYMPDSTGVSNPNNWYQVKSPSAYSTQSDKALAFFENLMMFITRSGIYAFSGEDIARGPADSVIGRYLVDSLSDNIEPDVLAFKNSLLDKAAAIDFDNKVWVAVPSSSSSTGNDKIYIYDYIQASSVEAGPTGGVWSVQDGPAVNNFTTYGGDLVGGGVTGGTVYSLLSTSYNFDGSAIDSKFKTVRFTGIPEHRDYTKVWRHAYITVDTPGDWPMDVTYWVDMYDESGTTEQISLNPGGALWGALVWGSGTWGAALERRTYRIILRNAVGKTIQFQFATNTADQYWKAHSIELTYNLRSRRGA